MYVCVCIYIYIHTHIHILNWLSGFPSRTRSATSTSNKTASSARASSLRSSENDIDDNNDDNNHDDNSNDKQLPKHINNNLSNTCLITHKPTHMILQQTNKQQHVTSRQGRPAVPRRAEKLHPQSLQGLLIMIHSIILILLLLLLMIIMIIIMIFIMIKMKIAYVIISILILILHNFRGNHWLRDRETGKMGSRPGSASSETSVRRAESCRKRRGFTRKPKLGSGGTTCLTLLSNAILLLQNW